MVRQCACPWIEQSGFQPRSQGPLLFSPLSVAMGAKWERTLGTKLFGRGHGVVFLGETHTVPLFTQVYT